MVYFDDDAYRQEMGDYGSKNQVDDSEIRVKGKTLGRFSFD